MANVLTIPQVSLPIGTRQFVTSNFAAISNNWVVTLNLVSWPASGTVMVLTTEASFDNGATFVPDAQIDLTGGPQRDRAGNPTNTVSWATSALLGTTTLRFTLNVQQACTISGSATAQ